jgi:hypothetical protein
MWEMGMAMRVVGDKDGDGGKATVTATGDKSGE